MATLAATPHRFTFEDVLAMYEVGILGPETRVELVDGVLVELSPPGPEHAGTVSWLTRYFARAAPDDVEVRVQDALLTRDGGYLMPDLFVCPRLSRKELPDGALLVVEVSHTSHAWDRQKAARYARIDVPEYWIVDTKRDEVVVHRDPRDGAYESVERYAPGDAIAPLVDVPPVDVAALLGS